VCFGRYRDDDDDDADDDDYSEANIAGTMRPNMLENAVHP
jgi:hypothetical protein